MLAVLEPARTGSHRLLKLCALRSTVAAMDTTLNTCTADHGAGFHLLARYACHAASNTLWICLTFWAGIGAAVNGGMQKTAEWTQQIHDSVSGSLRGVDFWSLHLAAAAAADGTKHPTQEFAQVTHNPPDLRLQTLLFSLLLSLPHTPHGLTPPTDPTHCHRLDAYGKQDLPSPR